MDNVAIMYSGGADSSTIIGELMADRTGLIGQIYPIVFDDDSTNFKTRRMVAIEQVVQHFGLYRNLQIVRSYNIELLRQKDTFGFIPGWKLSLQIAAMAYAQSLNCSTLYMGYCKENEEYPYTYKDELADNIHKAAKLYNSIYDADIKIVLPYIDMYKKDVIAKGIEIGVPYDKTISCRATQFGGLIHCGKCLPCKSRIQAFEAAGVNDPTIYWDKNAESEPVKFGNNGAIRAEAVKDHFYEAAKRDYKSYLIVARSKEPEWDDLTDKQREKWTAEYKAGLEEYNVVVDQNNDEIFNLSPAEQD
mgnify:CR=1 FL=1